MPSRVLFIFTSASKTSTGAPAGWYLPEAAHPYYELVGHGHTVDFASPAGANPPVNAGSVEMFTDDDSVSFLADDTVSKKLASALKLSDVKVEDYDAVFYVGGHGPVVDLAFDEVNIKLASKFYQAGKYTAAVCHGPAALVRATDASGQSIWAGKAFTGFSNAEEQQLETVKDIPFLLEDEIARLGGVYEKSAEPFAAHVVVSGNLITGQNPASGRPLAVELNRLLD
ncbi:hypothetical protein PLICRDRAFT_86276 [Plicaturopsis crispa FD-325 SS-3]|nr:hypothetical protein PLICRDRAFT_86276 [Plicaturopsis crispa FD-325 SS-3]